MYKLTADPDVVIKKISDDTEQYIVRDHQRLWSEFENWVAAGNVPEPADETPYTVLRAAEYPPITEYLDAQVKLASNDAAVKAAGQAQLNAYIGACLAVKAKIPKSA